MGLLANIWDFFSQFSASKWPSPASIFITYLRGRRDSPKEITDVTVSTPKASELGSCEPQQSIRAKGIPSTSSPQTRTNNERELRRHNHHPHRFLSFVVGN